MNWIMLLYLQTVVRKQFEWQKFVNISIVKILYLL